MNELEALRFASNILRTLSVSAEAADAEAARRAARMLDRYYAEPEDAS